MKRAAILVLAAGLGGCASAHLEEVGQEPKMSSVGSGIDPASQAIYAYPQAPASQPKRFSLWDDRQSKLFTDARALAPGDILTVLISINDSARFKNESERSRTSSRSLELGAKLSLPDLEVSTSGSGDGSLGSKTSTQGGGATARSENLDLSVAAVVTSVLPNGNLMISGSQEVRVNAELRILTIAGIVRTADIGADNKIEYERIAEARISYGGRGRLSEVQQPAYGHQILDKVLPF